MTNHAKKEQVNKPGHVKLNALALAVLSSTLLVSNPIQAAKVTEVCTVLNPAQKYHLKVDNKPFYMTSIQIRLDKLRYTYGFDAAAREKVIAKAAEDHFNTISFPVQWYEIEPSKDAFKWDILDEYLGLAKKYGLKVELLWFGQNSDGHAQKLGNLNGHLRVPDYVLRPTGKTPATASDYTIKREMSDYTLDLADTSLRQREKFAVEKLMDHIATWDADNGNNHTVIGVQVGNEVTGYNGVEFDYNLVISYYNDIASAVKNSAYSVWTRMNAFPGRQDSFIKINEALRQSSGSNIDFIGTDLYSSNTYNLTPRDITTALPYRNENFRMIMESGANEPAAALKQVAALASNNGYSHYDMLGPDGHGLYNLVGKTDFVENGPYVNDVRLVNSIFNSVTPDIATKVHGYDLFVHNMLGDSIATTTGVEGVTYTPVDSADFALSISHSNTELVLVSKQGGKFTWPVSLGVTAIQTGYFDSNNQWIKESDLPFSKTTPELTATPGKTILLTHGENYAVQGVRYQAEFAKFGGGTLIESNYLGFSGNGYANLPANNGYVEWSNVDGKNGGTRSIFIRHANGGSGKRSVNLIINGNSKTIVFPVTGSWSAYQKLQLNVMLNPGANNTIRIQSTGQDSSNIDEIEIL